MSMGNRMGSVNISIKKDVYNKLKKMKKKDESFSDIIRELADEGKDISKCFGLLKGDGNAERIEKEAAKSRKAKWRGVPF